MRGLLAVSFALIASCMNPGSEAPIASRQGRSYSPPWELARAFAAVVNATPSEYGASRAVVLELPGADDFLRVEEAHARTAEARALAEALRIRLETPREATVNPCVLHDDRHLHGACVSDEVEVYRPHPALAFERLDKGTCRGQLGTWELVQIVAASDHDAFERIEAILRCCNGAAGALVRIDRSRAISPLVHVLDSRSLDHDEVAEAAGALGGTGTTDREILDRLRRLYRSGDPVEQGAAMWALVELHDLGFADELESTLATPREYLFSYWDTVRALGQLLGTTSAGARFERLARDPSPARRRIAAIELALEQRHAPSRVAAMLALAADADPAVRARALEGLDTMLADDTSPDLRARSAEIRATALAGAASPTSAVRLQAVSLLIRLTEDNPSILVDVRRLARTERDPAIRAFIDASLAAR